ncbi:MAG: LysM peptidoglycan-binding domain-containing protein [Oscillospiraceae bacterium]|jgi:spore germination protein|nr:LysM peptidoglycan-binding domain-containing protein [Oscillospiraceae bacterium]
MTVYTVKPGDTIYSIARSKGYDPQELLEINRLSAPDALSAGQSILLPWPPATYLVSKGDTLYGIAKYYGLSVEAILAANPQIEDAGNIYVGQVLNLPPNFWGEAVTEGYAYPGLRPATQEAALPYLTYEAIFAYETRPAGRDGVAWKVPDDDAAIARAKKYGAKPLMVLANLDDELGGFKAQLIEPILKSGRKQEILCELVTQQCRKKGYAGVDVDFEYLTADLRDDFGGFLARLRAWLHAEGMTLSTAVAPKTKDDEPGLLYAGFDFAAHGRYCDRVLLMTYEWGYSGGEPMAVSPLKEVRKAVEYAVSRIPAQKVLLGINNYGYDWTLPYKEGTRAKVISNQEAPALAAQYGADIQYDQAAEAPFFTYNDGNTDHIVWFEDARSMEARFALVREFGLGGVGYWTVNNLFPQNFNLLADRFAIVR